MKLAQKLAVNYSRARLNLLSVVSKKKAAEKAFKLFCTPFTTSKKKTPDLFKKAEPLVISVEGITVRGFKWNRGGIKRVLILHGFESTCKNFDAYVKTLVAKNYEVVAFDAPAHGASGGKRITLPLYRHMIESVYFKLGGIQGFIAHSFGGLAAAHAMEKLPVDAGTRLVLIAPLTETSTAIDSFFRFLQLGDGVRTEFEKIIYEKSGAPAAHFSIPRTLQQIKASVLWIHDKNDDITPLKDVKPVIEQAYPNVSFLITEGLGHKKIYRDSRVVQAATDFL
ncbi:MAG: alpha/beta fold hydrolase [Bacteroidota bacterium]